MVAKASDGRSFPQQDRAFHTGLLARLDNSLVGHLVAAFWDVHTAVLPKLNAAAAADLDHTARTHGLMLEAAGPGHAEDFRTALAAHYEPIMPARDQHRSGDHGRRRT